MNVTVCVTAYQQGDIEWDVEELSSVCLEMSLNEDTVPLEYQSNLIEEWLQDLVLPYIKKYVPYIERASFLEAMVDSAPDAYDYLYGFLCEIELEEYSD